MRRVLCCVLCTLLILSLAIPVSAVETDSWVELLETGTVGNSGQNWFQYSTSATICIPTPRNMRCTKIDLLIAFTAGMAPVSVQLRYNGTLYKLTIDQIDSSTARIYGDIPDTYYSDMVLVFTRGSSTKCYTEILSCRVSPVSSQSYNVAGQVYIDGTYYSLAEHISMGGVLGIHSPESYLVYVLTDAWTKYDRLTIYGSVTDASISSVRVVLGSQILPFEVNFIDTEAGGGWQLWNENGYQNGDVITNTGDSYSTATWGRYLYSVSVDLTKVDRTKSSGLLQVTFTGDYDDMYGATFNCQAITGELFIPDTSGAGWLSWGKNMLTTLEQLPERIAEEMGKLFTPDEGKIESVQEQSLQLAEDRLGAVAQAGQVIDGLVGAFQNQTATDYLTVPLLTVPLGEVDWTIGGWTVQVVPDAFKPIVEVLKTVIDIICTLSFVRSMRNRLERLLVGGNA